MLAQKGAHVTAYEPFNPDYKFEMFKTTPSLEDAVFDADVIVLLVGHNQFKSLEPELLANITSSRIVVDIVNVWIRDEWKAAGYSFLQSEIVVSRCDLGEYEKGSFYRS